jgi:hypothetical protein
MFAVIFAASYIPDAYPSYFGDWLCSGSGEEISKKDYPRYIYENCNYFGFHDKTWHWGFRHWAWLCLGVTMLIINIVQLIIEEENRRNSKNK